MSARGRCVTRRRFITRRKILTRSTAASVLVVFLGMLLAPLTARAHATPTSFLTARAATPDAPVTLRWDIAVADLAARVALDADGDVLLTWGEIERAGESLTKFVLAGLEVHRDSVACRVEQRRDLALATHLSEPHVSFEFVFDCPRAGRLSISTPLLFGDDAQRTLLDIRTATGSVATVLSPSEPRWLEPAVESPFAAFARFVGQGTWHVWIGYDHLAFLLLLLLPSVLRPRGRVWADVVALVTTFAVAHSLTLALAATGTVTLPAGPVEFAIALSIVLAGALNLWRKGSRWRLPLAFGFGLVHGFGFANALSGLDIAGRRLVPLLAGFNVGVELAQLLLVALSLPLLLLWGRSTIFEARVAPALSIATAVIGGIWMIERWPVGL